jgi:hypothetical protein
MQIIIDAEANRGGCSMWFSEPTHQLGSTSGELDRFLNGVELFLTDVVCGEEFAILWQHDSALRALAEETLKHDIKGSIMELKVEIHAMGEPDIYRYGLYGGSLSFRLSVIGSIARQWDAVRRQFSIQEWILRMFDAIDALLDSAIDAANGYGGSIKGFKDALSAVVKADNEETSRTWKTVES